MINEILTAAALPFKEARFPDPPSSTFAIYSDDIGASGADLFNCIFTHEVTVELYEPHRDDAAEAAIEAELNARGIPWVKQGRYWLNDIRRYQVIYEFSYIVKT